MGRTAFLLCSLLILGQALCDDESPVVSVAQGALKGQKVTPDKLAPYYMFLGIPYARPPMGDLRFKAPLPAGPWNGTLDAVQEGNECMQPSNNAVTDINGNEDCLYLNVYTPELPGSNPLRPVMVWIHGGGFIKGSGSRIPYNPEYILNTGIVYVSINYRVGVLGFLSTEDAAAPGNAGLKDQVLALRWVKENIAAFGGDPDKVTIFGESAGAASVHYHMVSPMSKGLFRSAIADSGSVSSSIAVAKKPRKNAFLVGNALGFTGESTEDLLKFLRATSPKELVTASYFAINPEDQYRTMRVYHEAPTVEPVIDGEEAFVTEDPRLLLEAGKFHKLPYITGCVYGEGLLSTAILFGEGRTLQEIDKDFVKVFKPELRFCREEDCGDEMVAKMRSFYLGDAPLNNDNLQEFIDMSTDLYFAEGSYYSAKVMAAQSPNPVYFYNFKYNGGLAHNVYNFTTGNITGPGHGDELGYIFNYGKVVPDDSLDAKVRSRMVTLWTNFVKTSNPTPDVTEDIPAWLPFTNNITNYLDIGSQLELKTDYHKKRMDFWEDLYRKSE